MRELLFDYEHLVTQTTSSLSYISDIRMSRFDGKVCLITGASSGIGAATAIHLASLGCSVALNGRNLERLKAVSEKCREAGLRSDQIQIVPGDISKEEDAVRVVEETVTRFGRLDILVNNAGIPDDGKIGNIELATMSHVDHMFGTNFRSAFHMTQLAVPHLKRTRGNIVNVSSAASHLAMPRAITYGAAKAALDHLTKSVARDLGPLGIRVNAVNPGYVDTEIFSKKGLPEEQVKELLEKAKSLSVLQSIASPLEVAKPIAFLASDDASFITAVTMLVDGGLVLTGGSL